jgi:DNA-binding PadR family transcriptional regulator
METFSGFKRPTQNWSKLPHDFINQLPEITSVGELKVILYVLRHTWGFQEFDIAKKITVDEFENGRKLKDGSRIDRGTGLSKPTIIRGLRAAEEHGFITVVVDDQDAARVKKFYTIRMKAPEQEQEGSNSLTPGVKELYTNRKETLPRSEKETNERNLKKESDCANAQSSPDREPQSVDQQASKPEKEPTGKIDKRAIRAQLEQHFSDVTTIPKPAPTNATSRREAGALWWKPLKQLADLCEWNEDTCTRLISAVVVYMRSKRLTISSPKSILNTAIGAYTGNAPEVGFSVTPPGEVRTAIRRIVLPDGTTEEREVIL